MNKPGAACYLAAPGSCIVLFCAVLRLDGLFDLLLRGKELLIQLIGDPLIVVVLIQPDGVRSIEDLIAWCGPCAAVRRGQRGCSARR